MNSVWLVLAGGEVAFTVPPESWIRDRVARIQELLERKTEKSALLIRRLLGPIRLLPASTQSGRRYLRAETTFSVLPLIENEPASGPAEAGSSSFRWWRRGESNPRPKRPNVEILHAQSGLVFLTAASSGPDGRARQRS